MGRSCLLQYGSDVDVSQQRANPLNEASMYCIYVYGSNSHSYVMLAQLSEKLMLLMLIWDTDMKINKINTNNL